MSKNSRVILSKGIKMDRGYKNVLSYTESAIVTLLEEKSVANVRGVSFIKKGGKEVLISVPYGTCLEANYIGFQNEDYSEKWFFGWVDEVEYISEKTTKITFTVDSYSTWHDYWEAKTCFVEREHVTNDTIGLHTNPEPVNLGKAYIVENEIFDDYTSQNFATIVSGPPTGDEFSRPARTYNGVMSGLNLTVVKPVESGVQATNLNNEIESYVSAGTPDRLLRIFQYPSRLGGFGGIVNMYSNIIEFTNPTGINGYVPKNNKLYTYPYKKLILMSTSGENVELQYELFSEKKIKVDGVIQPSVGMKAYPINYRGLSKDYSKSVNLDCGIEVAWTGNAYREWLARNGVTEAIKGIGMIGNAFSGNIAGLTSDGASMINDFYQASKSSSGIRGSTTNAGLNIGEGNLGFRILQESIKSEVAREIDDYLSRYGYNVSELKVPNLNTRPYFNYVKIGSEEEIGYGEVPSIYMNDINNAFRNGTTIWKNHIHLGNYAVNNDI